MLSTALLHLPSSAIRSGALDWARARTGSSLGTEYVACIGAHDGTTTTNHKRESQVLYFVCFC